MKMFKKASALILALCMVLTTLALPVFADGETIVGDANIYRAPVGKTQKIEYSVVDSSSAKVDGITWSVSEYEGVSIDQNGVLSVSGSVAAGEITITATKEGAALATKTVTILEKTEIYSDVDRFFDDFEVYKDDEKIVRRTVSPGRSSIKYADLSGTGLFVGKEANGNTYAKATGLCYWGGTATFFIEPTVDGGKQYLPDASVVTIDGRFKTESASASDQSIMWFENAGLKLAYVASAESGKADIYDRAASKKLATVNTNEWFDLRVEFDHSNATYDVYLNNIEVVTAGVMTNNLHIGAGSRGNGFYIGASVDDLAIYNGRNADVVENVEISGDANIYRAPVGTTQKIAYTAEVPEGTIWSLNGAPAGVTIDQNGILKAEGSVSSGTSFNIQLINSGVVIGTKEISIPAKPELYPGGTVIGRYFEDFTRYDGTTVTNQGDIKFTSGLTATKTSDGNVYAKAYLEPGASWTSQTGKSLLLVNSWNPGNQYMPDASNVVVEGKFMAETPTGGEHWPIMNHDGLGIHIYYEFKDGEDYARVLFAENDAEGNPVATVVANVKTNEWFNARLELDYTDYTYSVFVDDVRVVKDKSLKEQAKLKDRMTIAISVDDFAMYNGTKNASFVDEKAAVITKNGEIIEDRKVDVTADGTLKLTVNKMMKNNSNLAKQVGAFVAVYGEDGRLLDVVCTYNTILPEVTGSLFVDLNQVVKAGDYAKIFIWDMESLQPLE